MVNGINSTNAIHTAVNPSIQRTVAAEPASQSRATDRLELTGGSHFLRALKAESSEVRADKVASIKAQIEAGTYEDDAKLDAAIDRLLDDLDL